MSFISFTKQEFCYDNQTLMFLDYIEFSPKQNRRKFHEMNEKLI